MKHLILPALAFSLFACAAPSAPHTPSAALQGAWQLVQVNGEAASGTLRFDAGDNSYSAHAGCNTLLGEYRSQGNRIRFSQAATTLMGCDPQRMAQDARLAESLAQGASWQQQGELLDIRDAHGKVLIRATR